MNLVIFIPGHVHVKQHIWMLREKELMKKKMQKQKPDWLNFEVVYTCDRWDWPSREELDSAMLDKVIYLLDRPFNGIVRPTKEAIKYSQEKYPDNCYLLRIGQDVILEIQKFCSQLLTLKTKSLEERFVIGSWDNDNRFKRWFRGEDKDIPERWKFIQGNFLLAPIKTWDTYYNQLPPHINHYADDSIFSFLVDKNNGKLVEWDRCWKHHKRNTKFPEYKRQSVIQPKLCTDPNKHAPGPAFRSVGENEVEVNGYDNYTIKKDILIPSDYASLSKKCNFLKPFFENNDFKGKSFLDLGSSTGFFSVMASKHGAGNVDSIDIDQTHLNVLQQVCDHFNIKNIHLHNVNVEKWKNKADVVCALALIHWVYSCTAVLASVDKIIEFFRSITNEILFIEWVDPTDSSISWFKHIEYNREFVQGEYNKKNFVEALRKYFAEFRKIGTVNKFREVYVAYTKTQEVKPETVQSVTSIVELKKDKGLVIKTLSGKFMEHGIYQNEIRWLEVLKDFDRTPNIIKLGDKKIVMTYVGERLTKDNLPQDWENQVRYILDQLIKYECCHNDIKPEEILVKDGKLHLIDFGWATVKGKPVPDEWKKLGLGERFRCEPNKFDDGCSLTKSVNEIRK